MNVQSAVKEDNLLVIENLSTKIRTPDGVLTVLEDVNLTMKKGEILAIVGESGSGKTMTITSILQLLPDTLLESYSGRVEVEGEDLIQIGEKDMQEIRGKKISLVAQNAMTSLDPSYRVGKQIVEIMLAKTSTDKRSAKKKALSLLEQMGVEEPERVFQSYPHQLSGGLRQRVVIAMSLACDPDLIIADEPTSALDPTVQLQVLDLFQEINRKFGTAILIITHDFGVVSRIADTVAVMYAGQIVEKGATEEVIFHPQHPYTQSLIKCIPNLDWIFDDNQGKKPLWQIKGEPPNLLDLPEGCRFAGRCHAAQDICHNTKPLLKPVRQHGIHHAVRCKLAEGSL
ncbi:ABC transporter ATP-binding protein [Bacillus massiliglaciei]|uniref:ABC transporter ATP-binding protein n=1 Tax=Bacillus massiliglaciei TaxID=1816693 RepID=UPI000A53E94E|nr:ABC transporter ATP-binding protein [Bacillus massiliglaciei]